MIYFAKIVAQEKKRIPYNRGYESEYKSNIIIYRRYMHDLHHVMIIAVDCTINTYHINPINKNIISRESNAHERSIRTSWKKEIDT